MTTKAEVMDAALRLFAQHGYQATTMRMIANEVGVSVGALYNHEPTKEDILMRIMRAGMNDLLADVAATLAMSAGDPISQLRAVVTTHVRVHGEQQLASLVSDTEIRSLSPENRASILTLRRSYEDIWRRILEEGRAAGLFQVDPGTARLALLQMCTGVVYWYSPDGKRSLEHIANEFADLATNLVCARPREEV